MEWAEWLVLLIYELFDKFDVKVAQLYIADEYLYEIS
jgi:hypothetical protein